MVAEHKKDAVATLSIGDALGPFTVRVIVACPGRRVGGRGGRGGAVRVEHVDVVRAGGP